jgi:hypothetical protein
VDPSCRQTALLTLSFLVSRYEHNFEDAHFEHDRIDAVAMERLTSSPHVINVFGFCGHSVLTEYADVSRVGELADKAKKKPLARLKIASDIANGLADVHGIDGDGDATFVHLDVNPANVVSVGGTLKLNDFNIGIIRRWNTTSNSPCGFPAQYPNPQVCFRWVLTLLQTVRSILYFIDPFLYLFIDYSGDPRKRPAMKII